MSKLVNKFDRLVEVLPDPSHPVWYFPLFAVAGIIGWLIAKL